MFPASAGMNRSPSPLAIASLRTYVPRERGDEPASDGMG